MKTAAAQPPARAPAQRVQAPGGAAAHRATRLVSTESDAGTVPVMRLLYKYLQSPPSPRPLSATPVHAQTWWVQSVG